MGIRINEHGKIIFRHPHVHYGKYGKVICVAVAKHTGERQGKIKDCLEALLKAQPRLPDDFKGEQNKIAMDAYFGPMGLKTTDDLIEQLKDGTYPVISPEQRQANIARQTANGGNLSLAMLIDAQREIMELKASRAALEKQLGARSEEEKTRTLWECYVHAYFFLPMREGAKNTGRFTILRRAGAVLEALGLDRPYASVTKDEIIQAVIDSGAYSDFEKYARKQAVKRVLSFLCKPEDESGLGFSINPAKNMVVGSIASIQNKKRQDRGPGKGVLTLDPLPFIEKLEIYEKAMTALLGFAGLRLAECAALEWDRIDFEKKLIHIEASENYPELKSDHSYRDVKPFQNVWLILEAFKKEKLHRTLLFPRRYPPTQIKRKRTRETWFDLHHGDVKVIELSNYFRTRLEEQTGLKFKEPARRLRRWWETKMRSAGFGDILFAMSGHDNKVGQDFYTRRQELVASAAVGKVT